MCRTSGLFSSTYSDTSTIRSRPRRRRRPPRRPVVRPVFDRLLFGSILGSLEPNEFHQRVLGLRRELSTNASHPRRRAIFVTVPQLRAHVPYPSTSGEIRDRILIKRTAFVRLHLQQILKRQPAQVRGVEGVHRDAVPQAPLTVESVVESSAWNCRIARHHYVRLTTRHHTIDRSPDSRLDARSLVGQNQNVPAMISLEILDAVSWRGRVRNCSRLLTSCWFD
jgi:hypothetical protein